MPRRSRSSAKPGLARLHNCGRNCRPYLPPIPGLSAGRRLANAVWDSAMLAHLRGHDGEAIERVRDMLHLARCFRQDNITICQLVAISIDALACSNAQAIAPGLRFDGSSTTQPATRQQVQQLIAALLDEELAWREFSRAILFERLVWAGFLSQRGSGSWFLRPLMELETMRNNANVMIEYEASQCRTLPQAQVVLRESRREPAVASYYRVLGTSSDRTVPRYSRWYHYLDSNLSGAITLHFRTMAERRATAVSLAAQLYRADHGQWPARLAELVPAYLPAVPADPFHDDGRPLAYVMLKAKLPGGQDRPLLYIDAGDDVPVRDEPMYSWQSDARPVSERAKEIRQYRDLSRFVPSPSTKAVDHDPQEPDAPGQQPQ